LFNEFQNSVAKLIGATFLRRWNMMSVVANIANFGCKWRFARFVLQNYFVKFALLSNFRVVGNNRLCVGGGHRRRLSRSASQDAAGFSEDQTESFNQGGLQQQGVFDPLLFLKNY